MKILAIRGANLASLAEPFEMDLDSDPLRSAGLFLIWGPTGAGKSTLLDAICLALYDQLPRLRDAGKAKVDLAGDGLVASDPKAILRHGAAEAFAEIDFLGRDQGRYRARWSVRRARGKLTGNLMDAQRTLTDLVSGERLTDKKKETQAAIEARTGLDFEQFRRSALLAQGEFDAFLRAGGDQRAALLEKVSGGEIFSALSRAAHDRAKTERARLEAIDGELARASVLERARRVATLAEIARVEALRMGLAAQRDALEAALAWRLERDRRAERAEATARAANQAHVARASALATARAGVATLSRRGRAELAAEESWRATNGPRVDVAARAEDLTAHLETRGAALEVIAKAEELGADLDARFSELSSSLEDLENREREEVAANETAAEALAARQARLAEFDEAKLRERRDQLALLDAALSRTRTALETAEAARVERCERETARDQALAEQTAAVAAQSRISPTLPQLEAAAKAENAAFERWSVASSRTAVQLRALLTEGAPCPVCGATDHALTEFDAVIAAERAAQQERAAAAQTAFADAQTDLARLQERALSAGRRIEDAMREITRQEATANAAEATWRAGLAELSGGLSMPDSAAAALSAAEAAELTPSISDRLSAARRSLHAETQDWDTANIAERKARTIREQARARLEKIRADREAAVAARSRLVEERAESERALALARQSAAEASRALTSRLSPIWPDWSGRETPEIVREINICAREVAEHDAARLRLGAEVAELEGITTWIEDLGRDFAASEEALCDVADIGELDAATLRHQAASARDAHLQAASRAEQAASDLHAWRASPPESVAELGVEEMSVEQSDAARAALRAEIDAATEARERLQGEISADNQRRENRAEILRRYRRFGRASKIWRQLDDLVGSADGKKFRNIAQARTLRALIGLANARLKDLHPRYRLRAGGGEAGDLSLEVIDRDMADAVRGAHNLSGGERFLVSLALALGLASMTSERSGQVATLFIDEGFGSLDGESLSLAISALEALQATGRQIGLISHVDELKERIGAQVEIAPQGGGVSRLRLAQFG